MHGPNDYGAERALLGKASGHRPPSSKGLLALFPAIRSVHGMRRGGSRHAVARASASIDRPPSCQGIADFRLGARERIDCGDAIAVIGK